MTVKSNFEVSMINPVIHTFNLFGYEFALRWYGVIVMLGVIVGSLIVEREIKRRGGNGDQVWDVLVWVLPIGILGARLWFVLNATLGGDDRYMNDPAEILRIWNGGLHIFGGFLFGAITLLIYLRRNNLDPWLFLDSAGPAVLIGQGLGRIANFINQELYGPPTTLPWGIPIQLEHRLSEFSDPNQYPFETTRFHPTFAYEMLWNFAAAGLLLWLSRRYKVQIKPGTIFAGWLLLAGFGRVWIEFFRPDQPKIPDLGISYSAVFAALMAIAGAVMLMARYKAINLSFAEDWEEEYQIADQPLPQQEVVSPKATSTRKVPVAGKAAKTKKPKAKTKTPARTAVKSTARTRKTR
jgi:phosphatidylglycerol:prolipoprotein diacylglycerol transferase